MFAPECDAENPSIYFVRMQDGEPVYACRCMVCARCNKHTGNTTQGHYWSYCLVTRSTRTHHFCCDNDCELESSNR